MQYVCTSDVLHIPRILLNALQTVFVVQPDAKSLAQPIVAMT